MGWDQGRETILQRGKEIGLVPADTELTLDPDTPEWEFLSADEKRLYAWMMEVFTGFQEHTHYHFGRILQYLEETGELDNTLVMVISDGPRPQSFEYWVGASAHTQSSELISAPKIKVNADK